MKFFVLIPALRIKDNREANTSKFKVQLRMIRRFCMACNATLSRIMSSERTVPDMEGIIKIYLDTMFEIDKLLVKQ